MKRLSLLTAALVLAGCASSGYGTAAGEGAGDVRPQDVVFYTSEDDIAGEYEVVEVIVPPSDLAREGSGYDNARMVERFARRRAVAVGANGILVVRATDPEDRSRAAAAVRNGFTLDGDQMVAVRITPPPQR